MQQLLERSAHIRDSRGRFKKQTLGIYTEEYMLPRIAKRMKQRRPHTWELKLEAFIELMANAEGEDYRAKLLWVIARQNNRWCVDGSYGFFKTCTDLTRQEIYDAREAYYQWMYEQGQRQRPPAQPVFAYQPATGTQIFNCNVGATSSAAYQWTTVYTVAT